MNPVDWFESAAADAVRRGLPDARAVLDGLRRAAEMLRAADWNDDASGTVPVAAQAPAQ
jgi:hypothetical protein